MDFSSARSERFTAIASTLVAIAILAGGVTAYQSHNAPVDDVVQLESDLRFQLEVAFRHDPNERARRLVKLEEVSQAWHQSSRTTADREQLASWLLEATIRSMPGSIEVLPVVPHFGETTSPQTVAQSTPDVLVEPLPNEIRAEENLKNRAEENGETVTQEPTLASPATEKIRPSTDSTQLLAVPQPEVATFLVAMSPVAMSPVAMSPLATFPVTMSPIAVSPFVKTPRINLTELGARVAGYHQGLDEIDATLLIIEPANLTALSEQIRLLEELTQDFRFIRLYYQTLTDRESRAVIAPRSMAATLAEIERRINRTQEARSGDFLGEFDLSNQNEIADLRQQLAGVTSRLDR